MNCKLEQVSSIKVEKKVAASPVRLASKSTWICISSISVVLSARVTILTQFAERVLTAILSQSSLSVISTK